jgi:Reverse transcriptase (RNA-dependent DNA polymerase)
MSPEDQYRSSQFAEMPRGFAEPGKVLRLKKNLYGKKVAPRLWFQHLHECLVATGFQQMIDVNPCLFILDKVICLVYVDDTLLYAHDMKDSIDDVIRRLTNEHKMTLEVEDNFAGFLGVHIDRNKETGEVTLTQKGLIDRILEALQVEDLPPVDTPAIECLGKHPLGDPASASFNYSSVIGMLWYLYGHSRSDLGFAVSQAARFTFQPKSEEP